MTQTAVVRTDAVGLTADDIFDLEGAYVDWVRNEPRDNRQGVFHPSAAGMCGRRGVYEYIGTPRVYTDTDKDLEVFRIGHAVHDIVQSILGDLRCVLEPRGIEVHFEAEVPFDPATDTLMQDFGLGGTCDGLLTLSCKAEGWVQRSVVEIKSSKDKLFQAIRAPKEDHVKQASIYAFRYNVPIIYYWYYNKDNSERKVFREVFNDAAFDEAINKFASMRWHAEDGTLPEREESFYFCPRCEYSHTCKPETLARISREKTLTRIKTKGFGNK